MHSYAYVADSRLDEARHALGLQTSGGRAPNPRFFTGFLGDSQQAATALLAIAKVAGTRYFQPTGERLRDPVVTCNGDRLLRRSRWATSSDSWSNAATSR